MSEDARNEPLCERFRAIRDGALMGACTAANRGTEESLARGIESAQDGMIELFKLHRARYGKDPDGNDLPPEQILHIYPSDVYEDEQGEYESLMDDNGVETRNYQPSIPFKETALFVAMLGHLLPEMCAELKSCDADMNRFEEARDRGYQCRDEVTFKDEHYLNRLLAAINYTCTRLEPKDEAATHPNYPVSSALRKLSHRLQTAPGNGFAWTVLATIDPVEALSSPPPPEPEVIIERLDGVFRDLYQLIHGPNMKVEALRDTEQCRLGLKGSIRFMEDALKRAVKDLESKGVELPQYRSVAGRGHQI